MKKLLNVLLIMAILMMVFFVGNVKAVALDNVQISTDKEIVNPGSEITLTINFGKDLGAYTFDIAYDSNLLEYISTDAGTPNDDKTRVRIVYYDSTGGTNPKSSMQVKFKAKEGLTTSNPTNFAITAEGLSNADASETYDDIVVPIEKNIVVEPIYENYEFTLTYTGNPIVNEEKEMTLRLISSMGRYYDHARILAEVQTPEGANAKLLGTDENSLEHDLIDSGWGDPSGYEIGGDVDKVLNLRGIFDKEGQYTLTFKLIDRDNSDTVIATNNFVINVESEQPEVTLPEEPTQEPTVEENTTTQNPETNNNQTNEQLPEELPRTGYNLYIPIILSIILILVVAIVAYIKSRKVK